MSESGFYKYVEQIRRCGWDSDESKGALWSHHRILELEALNEKYLDYREQAADRLAWLECQLLNAKDQRDYIFKYAAERGVIVPRRTPTDDEWFKPPEGETETTDEQFWKTYGAAPDSGNDSQATDQGGQRPNADEFSSGVAGLNQKTR